MREILFRGRRTDSGEWVYGNLIHLLNAPMIFPSGSLSVPKGYFVTPETVGQYTGLDDKNGVKIFEGDVLSGEYYFRGEGWFDTGEGEFSIDDPVIFESGKFTCRGFDLCEIIEDVMNDTRINTKHWEKTMLHANWETED